MTPEKLSIYFDTSPAVSLLKADHSPYIVCFLYERFKRAHAIDVAHSDLLPALTTYQERLQEAGYSVLRDKPEDYLRDLVLVRKTKQASKFAAFGLCFGSMRINEGRYLALQCSSW